MQNKFVGSRWFYGLCCMVLFSIETLIALYVHDTVIRPYVGDMLVVVLVYCFVRILLTVLGEDFLYVFSCLPYWLR